jgi:hypothetical protein
MTADLDELDPPLGDQARTNRTEVLRRAAASSTVMSCSPAVAVMPPSRLPEDLRPLRVGAWLR